MPVINPFDAADLTNYIEANHVLNWYARLSDAMKQRCVDTIIDTNAVLSFIGQAAMHLEHSPDDFDTNALHDLHNRVIDRMSR